ncbi:hypothetical protein AAC387_Pa02g4922 [Persea americana]
MLAPAQRPPGDYCLHGPLRPMASQAYPQGPVSICPAEETGKLLRRVAVGQENWTRRRFWASSLDGPLPPRLRRGASGLLHLEKS